jgi:hypothetical protein
MLISHAYYGNALIEQEMHTAHRLSDLQDQYCMLVKLSAPAIPWAAGGCLVIPLLDDLTTAFAVQIDDDDNIDVDEDEMDAINSASNTGAESGKQFGGKEVEGKQNKSVRVRVAAGIEGTCRVYYLLALTGGGYHQQSLKA